MAAVNRPADPETVRAWVAASRAAQGLPPAITDPVVLRRIAVILRRIAVILRAPKADGGPERL